MAATSDDGAAVLLAVERVDKVDVVGIDANAVSDQLIGPLRRVSQLDPLYFRSTNYKWATRQACLIEFHVETYPAVIISNRRNECFLAEFEDAARRAFEIACNRIGLHAIEERFRTAADRRVNDVEIRDELLQLCEEHTKVGLCRLQDDALPCLGR